MLEDLDFSSSKKFKYYEAENFVTWLIMGNYNDKSLEIPESVEVIFNKIRLENSY